MDKQKQQAYLEAMGIECWVSRKTEPTTFTDTPIHPKTAINLATSEIKSSHSDRPNKTPPPKITKKSPLDTPSIEAPPAWFNEAPPSTEDDYLGLESAEFDMDFDEITPPVPMVSQLDWSALSTYASTCQLCSLSDHRKQVIFGSGNQAADLLIIGDAPDSLEDKQGRSFLGDSGQLLDAMLGAMGITRKDAYITHIVKCHPMVKQTLQAEDVACCHAYLDRQIQLIQPKAILLLGRTAAQSLLNSDLPLNKLRLMNKTYGKTQIPLVTSFHPSYLLRSPEEKSKTWQDLLKLTHIVKH